MGTRDASGWFSVIARWFELDFFTFHLEGSVSFSEAVVDVELLLASCPSEG